MHFLLILLHERIRRRISDGVDFSTLIDIVAETAIVSFQNTARWFPTANNLQEESLFTLFCPLILDHGVSLIIAISGAKIQFRKSCSILLLTIVFNL